MQYLKLLTELFNRHCPACKRAVSPHLRRTLHKGKTIDCNHCQTTLAFVGSDWIIFAGLTGLILATALTLLLSLFGTTVSTTTWFILTGLLYALAGETLNNYFGSLCRLRLADNADLYTDQAIEEREAWEKTFFSKPEVIKAIIFIVSAVVLYFVINKYFS